ncbi:Clavaminate synthase-like protein [Stereum hirsutum FP-91666 SS1]|uniref:Clavaminate synthase-like protein n=1 Tax=Stereum hirsutum (strain FP-91666) TaxID=721885 RepID=UPI000440FAF2|nr:Clavaminate synthase-like protein [Stereum hirsutum FP-91666 SS1]EIM91457.1 Clavaminate synthase-like protein [Stereum hirsutum FP-91666 SS1]
MPAITLPSVPHWTPAPVTTEALQWADLEVIDLSKAKTADGRAELAIKARDAMHTQGFFYVINHGLEKSQTERIFDIAAVPFDGVAPEEQKAYVADMKAAGEFEGYKPLQYWASHIDNGVRDRMEQYNFNRNVHYKEHPQAIRPLLPEIQEFIRFNHEEVLHELERLLALGLELPEDTLTHITSFEQNNNGYFRFMRYHPRPEEEEVRSGNLWLKGHTDAGAATILWSQEVAALQIRNHEDSEWRWVKHIENALVVNCGDALTMLSGGYYKSAIHRVVQPPSDQRGYQRLGVFYFASFDDDVPLKPLEESPVLQRNGLSTPAEKRAPLMGEWRKARVAAYGTSELKKSAKKGVEEEFINGIPVKHYA